MKKLNNKGFFGDLFVLVFVGSVSYFILDYFQGVNNYKEFKVHYNHDTVRQFNRYVDEKGFSKEIVREYTKKVVNENAK